MNPQVTWLGLLMVALLIAVWASYSARRSSAKDGSPLDLAWMSRKKEKIELQSAFCLQRAKGCNV